MVHDNGMLETESEKLMESFEQVSQHIAQGQIVLSQVTLSRTGPCHERGFVVHVNVAAF